MSRRSSTPTVTLFPFLAVLVCTMGSLILLLLVTTRRIQDQVETKTTPRAPIAADASADIESLRKAEQRRAALADAEKKHALREREIAARQAAYQQALQDRNEQLAALESEWERRNRELAQSTRELEQQTSVARQQAQAASQELKEAKELQIGLRSLIDRSGTNQQALDATRAQLQNEALTLIQQRERLREKLRRAEREQAQARPRFRVVAYDGNSGTERRPILIECRSDSLTFAAERIELSAATLNEFTPEVNPLLAGTQALLDYWQTFDAKTNSDAGKPYVLLIVRPGGTIGFYVARKYLESLGEDFGYELVNAGDQLAWPDPDPQAVAVCRDAIERVMRGDRPEERQYSHRLGPGENSPFPARERIVGTDGDFHLADVDQLRRGQAGDEIDMLSPEWRPDHGRRQGATDSSSNDFSTRRPVREHLGGDFTPDSGLSSSRQAANQARNAGSAYDVSRQPERYEFADPKRQTEQSRSPVNSTPPQNALDQEPLAAALGNRNGMPPSPFETRPQTNRWERDGGKQRRWGQSRPDGSIGIEREVVLHLYADHLELMTMNAEIGPEMGRPEFQKTVSAMLEQHALTWGEPPQSFTWRPVLKAYIHPGGNQHFPRLKELAEHWGLSIRSEQVLN